jgi:aspartate racemase
MKTIGIIGGMSAESTAIYYELFNKGVRDKLGGLHSAELLIRSLDFAPIAEMQASGRWAQAGEVLAAAATGLQCGGADLIVLATNTMHKVIEAVEMAVTVPVVNIADCTARAIKNAGLQRPGLIATRFTMEDGFYVDRLLKQFGLDPIVPEADERAEVHKIIYEELCQGIVTEPSRAAYVAVAAKLIARGADCIILGCTEVCMLLDKGNVDVPVFDTVALHVDEALRRALDQAPCPSVGA